MSGVDYRSVTMQGLAKNDSMLKARLAERDRPSAAPIMFQRWENLLFLHWTWDPDELQAQLPSGLTIDTFSGQAWVGVVPFSMRGVRPRFLPAVPGLSDFPEVNLRTYVVDERGRPGVWFFSLDTPKRLPNWIARNFFHLNYRRARIHVAKRATKVDYRSELWSGGDFGPLQRYTWQTDASATCAEPGTLEFFLCERYRLFAYNPRRKRILTGQVHHRPYPLQRPNLESWSAELFTTNGLTPPIEAPVSVLCSAGVDVSIYPMSLVEA